MFRPRPAFFSEILGLFVLWPNIKNHQKMIKVVVSFWIKRVFNVSQKRSEVSGIQQHWPGGWCHWCMLLYIVRIVVRMFVCLGSKFSCQVSSPLGQLLLHRVWSLDPTLNLNFDDRKMSRQKCYRLWAPRWRRCFMMLSCLYWWWFQACWMLHFKLFAMPLGVESTLTF